MLGRDSTEYELLSAAAAEVVTAQVPGLTCEIGVRAGGGSQVILDELAGSPLPYTHLVIDPWGGWPYPNRRGHSSGPSEYDERMRRQTLADLYWYANTAEVDLLAFVMTDSEFFARFAEGVWLYRNGERRLVNDYALVHFDGPHTTEKVLEEVGFFGPRAPLAARWVFDDFDWYDWRRVRDVAATYGFTDARLGERKRVLVRRG